MSASSLQLDGSFVSSRELELQRSSLKGLQSHYPQCCQVTMKRCLICLPGHPPVSSTPTKIKLRYLDTGCPLPHVRHSVIKTVKQDTFTVVIDSSLWPPYSSLVTWAKNWTIWIFDGRKYYCEFFSFLRCRRNHFGYRRMKHQAHHWFPYTSKVFRVTI
jgi:hypothetical protein